ncbi:MAG: RNA methyltransferase [Chloroflexia bacterium]|nr:RNA methyltransferase [Chloroflexia bacterium]
MITSATNATVKAARRLRHRRAREESGTFLIEGIRLVGQALESGATIRRLMVAPELLDSTYARGIVERLRSSGVDVVDVSPAVFRGLSARENPQGIAAVVQQVWTPLGEITHLGGLGWVALDAVADPGNLGTILRTCDAVGCEGVLLLGAATDPHDPSAVRASMGAIFSQQMARASFEEFAAWKTAHGHSFVGTSGESTQLYRAVAYPAPMVLLMGSERQGLTVAQREICDAVVRIPMVGTADSLNLAVATSVVLYEVFHQQQSR